MKMKSTSDNKDISEDAELSEEGLWLKPPINSKLGQSFTEEKKDITRDIQCSAVQCSCDGNPEQKHKNQDLTFLACKHGHGFTDKYRL